MPAEESIHSGEAMFQQLFHDFHTPFEEIFDRLWSNFSPLTRSRTGTMGQISLEVLLTPEQAERGGRVRVSIPLQVTCPTCRGRGSAGPYVCWYCSGAGTITEEYPLQLSFPAGMVNNDIIRVSLGQFGIYDTHLTVHFRLR
jgi:molecular chaperone DnaJ